MAVPIFYTYLLQACIKFAQATLFHTECGWRAKYMPAREKVDRDGRGVSDIHASVIGESGKARLAMNPSHSVLAKGRMQSRSSALNLRTKRRKTA